VQVTDDEQVFYPSIEVTVQTEPEQTQEWTSPVRGWQTDRDLVTGMVANPQDIVAYDGLGVAGAASGALPAGAYDYVIITGTELAPGFAPLLTQKQSRGLDATLYTVEDIYANYSGVDVAAQVREFIRDAYTTWGTEYVLLGGDVDVVPYRGGWGQVASQVPDDDTMPTDLYFACLDGSWNGDGDSIWGEFNDGEAGGEVDLLAEVYVGRAPVETGAEVANFVNKTVQYETMTPTNPAEGLWVGEYLGWMGYGSESKEPIADEVMPAEYTFTTAYDVDGTFSAANVIAGINAEPHAVNHLGHASEGLVIGLTPTAIQALGNDYPFLVYSQGCYAGAFDYEDAVSEWFVKDDAGAFASVMNSRYGWGPPLTRSHYFDYSFFEVLFAPPGGQDPDPSHYDNHLGAANQLAKELNLFRVETSGTDRFYRWIYFELNLLGDPETPFRQPGLNVIGSDPASGEVVSAPPTAYTIDLGDPYDPNSVDASDLRVNGVPADGVLTVDDDTLRFTFTADPVTGQGLQTMMMAAGALTRLADGADLSEWGVSFCYDVAVMEVVATDPADGGVGDLVGAQITLTVDFNEPYHAGTLGTDDLSVSRGTVVQADVVDADTVDYTIGDLFDEGPVAYVFASGALTDPYGNPMLSHAGSFDTDADVTAYPTPLEPEMPRGSLVYDPSVTAWITPVGDTDTFTLDVDDGQTITVVVDPEAGLRPQVELRDPASALIGSAAAGGDGKDAVLQIVPTTSAGTCAVVVGGAGGSTGQYTLRVIVNAVVEDESHDGPVNNDASTAQDLDATFLSLTGDAERTAVLGAALATETIAIGPEGFESGDLGPLWTTHSSSMGRIQVTGAYGTASGDHALLMDREEIVPMPFYALNEAIIALPLTGMTEAFLSFWHAEWGDEEHPFTGDFTGSVNADGIAISDDGVNWHPIWTAPAQESGVWEHYMVDLAAEAAAAGMTLGPGFRAKFQQYDDYGLPADGRGWDDLALMTSEAAEDWYRFTMDAGESATLALAAQGEDEPASLELYADFLGAPLLLASGIEGGGNVTEVIPNGVAPWTGTYYVRVAGFEMPYSLVVTKNSGFDVEPNDTLATSQDITGQPAVLGYVGQDGEASLGVDGESGEDGGHPDWFSFSATAGNDLTVATLTPAGDPQAPFEFHNALDPSLELYDPTGALVAWDDNSGADGKNAALVHTAAMSGSYAVRVAGAEESTGEYVLTIQGATGAAPGLEVTSTDPADGARLAEEPGQIAVDFSQAVVLGSWRLGAVRIDGSLPATDCTVVDGDTLAFDFDVSAGLSEGWHTLEFAAGAVTDVRGMVLEAYVGQFYMDRTPPRVVGSSVQDGGVVPLGLVTYTVQFDETLSTAGLDEADFALTGVISGDQSPRVWDYDPTSSTLTLTYSGLIDDRYTLQLFSGDGQLEDDLGWDLDGEPVAWPIPPYASGDGVEGGDFALNVFVDGETFVYPTPLQPELPWGSLVYDPSAVGWVSHAGDTDGYTLGIDDGQTITVVVAPDAALLPIIELVGPGDVSIGGASAGVPGQAARLQVVPTTGPGTYTVVVGGAAGTTGQYEVRVMLNAAAEDEASDEMNNEEMASAQNIDASFIDLGGGVERGAVVGSLPSKGRMVLLAEGFELGALGPAWSTYTSDEHGIVRVDDYAHYGGQYALWMGRDERYGYTLHEAVWTIDLSGVPNPYLSFRHRDFADPWNPFSGDFVDHYNADGVAISDDGVHWHPVTNVGMTGWDAWNEHTIDLAAEAQAAGMVLGPDLRIKFQHYGETIWFDAHAWDELAVWVPTEDWYSFSLEAGESASIVLTPTVLGEPAGMGVYNEAGDRLAVGSLDAYNADRSIDHFIAPASGTYYVRVTGGAEAYSLVVIRGGAFDLEPNDSLETAQDITGRAGVLGYVSRHAAGLFAVNWEDGAIYILDPQDGAILDQLPAPSTFVPTNPYGLNLSATPDLLDYNAGHWFGNTVVAQLDIDDGTILSGWAGPGWPYSALARVGNEIFVSDTEYNRIYVLDPVTGRELRWFKAPNPAVGLAGDMGEGRLFVVNQSDFSRVYEFDPATGKEINSAYDANIGLQQGMALVGDELFVSETLGVGMGDWINVYDKNTLEHLRTLTMDMPDTSMIGGLGGDGDPGGDDWFSFYVEAGDNLTIATQTPAGDPQAPYEFRNPLDPYIELYDPTGALVAWDDDGGPDAKNALVTHAASMDGTYVVRILAASETSGEYVLTVEGATGSLPSFGVAATDPADAERLDEAPTRMTVTFSDGLLLTTLDASDLIFDGTTPASGYELQGYNIVAFDVPAGLTEGWHTVQIAAGAVLDVQGTPVEAHSGQFKIDLTDPIVIASSVQEGDVLPPGSLVYSVQFSEEMRTADLDETDFSLVGVDTGAQVPVAFGYDPSGTTLTLEYEGLLEDAYTLTLFGHSGKARFCDLAGRWLDGDPVAWPIPPNVSGDGDWLGDFYVNFTLDTEEGAYPTPLAAVQPYGSLVYDPVIEAEIGAPGDTDAFTLIVDTGQTMTVVVDPAAGLRPSVALYDPSDVFLGGAVAGASGQYAVLQTTATTDPGTYTIVVGAEDGTTGRYVLQVILNAAVEDESHDGSDNDSLWTAQDIEPTFIDLAGGATRGAVLGAFTSTTGVVLAEEDFESGQLGPAWSTYTSRSGGRVQITGEYGTAGGSYAMLMDYRTAGAWTLNEAIWTVDLSGQTAAFLSFWHADWEGAGEQNKFDGDFVDHYNADGIAISDDGVHWHPIWDAADQPTDAVWEFYTLDLAAGAAEAGMVLGPDFRIKFQQYDSWSLPTDGRGWDEITISLPSWSEDWYRFDLEAGESAMLTLTGRSGYGRHLELRGADGSLLASGSTGPSNVDEVIEFLAPDAGTYYALVTGDHATYTLVVTQDAAFNLEFPSILPPQGSETAQDLDGYAAAVGVVTGGRDRGPMGSHWQLTDMDVYRVTLGEGDELTLRTLTPADGPGEWANTLDPMIRLYDSTRALVAWDDNSAPDGRNAELSYVVPAGGAGVYCIRVGPSRTVGWTSGEYVLEKTITGGDIDVERMGAPVLTSFAEGWVGNESPRFAANSAGVHRQAAARQTESADGQDLLISLGDVAARVGFIEPDQPLGAATSTEPTGRVRSAGLTAMTDEERIEPASGGASLVMDPNGLQEKPANRPEIAQSPGSIGVGWTTGSRDRDLETLDADLGLRQLFAKVDHPVTHWRKALLGV